MSPPDRFKKAGASFARLCEIMAKLRAPGGCPWDREQTLTSLKPYLIEEAYEVLDAMDAGNASEHRDELGDLLLQVVFQAELTHEAGGFDVAAVAEAVANKLVRRHPHVFADRHAADAAGALAHWEEMKARERSPVESSLDGIPRTLPALLGAQRTGEKAGAAGFDWEDRAGVEAKVEEEWAELRQATAEGDEAAVREELGDLLFAISNLARHLGVDAESALRAATDKFSQRYRRVEAELAARGQRPKDVDAKTLDDLWTTVKQSF